MKTEFKPQDDGLDFQIIRSLDELGNLARKSRMHLNLYNLNAVEHLKSLPAEQKLRMLSQLNSYIEIFETASEQINPENEWGPPAEFHCLSAALWKYNLYSKVDLKNYISDGDVIEIYNRHAVQIYRNFEFLQLCSYSLLEVMTMEWFVLYDRPEFVTEMLFKSAGEVLQAGEVINMTIPDHVMREKHLDGRKVFMTHFKYFVPLFEKGDPAPAAFLATCQATSILEEGEGLNVAMLERKRY